MEEEKQREREDSKEREKGGRFTGFLSKKMKSPVVLGRHWEQGWTSCLRQGACAASGGAGGRQGVSRLPTTRRDASLAHRSASFAAYYSPHVRYVRTYVRTLPLRPLSLSLPLFLALFLLAYIDASRARVYVRVYSSAAGSFSKVFHLSLSARTLLMEKFAFPW